MLPPACMQGWVNSVLLGMVYAAAMLVLNSVRSNAETCISKFALKFGVQGPLPPAVVF